MRKVVGALLLVLIIGVVVASLVRALLETDEDAATAELVPTPLPPGVLPTPTLLSPAALAALTPEAVTITHTIQSGETMGAISLFYRVPEEKILEANGLSAGDIIYAGQELLVPDVIPTVTPTVGPTVTIAASLAGLPPKPEGLNVNGIPENVVVVMPENVRRNAQAIYERGRSLGRNPRAFSKVGDSTTENPFFLARFDETPYNLGDYAYLQPVIDFYQGSFARDSAAVRVGLHSWTLFDSVWADKTVCQAGEAPLACEIRLHNPSIILFRLGSNDMGVPDLFNENMRQAVEYAIENGVIPVIGTKADRSEGSNENNDILRRIAADYEIPLWDFDQVAGTVPGRGLDVDNVHMTTFYEHDYTLPEAFQRGHALHNLTALMVLDTLWKEVILAAEN